MAYRRSPLMQERLADNRARIMKAARHLIARGGFRAASIAAVAQEVGLSTGAMYRYFPSKADLYVEALTNAVDQEVSILRKLIQRPGSATERLQSAVESFAGRALKGPNLAYAFIAEPASPEVEAARIECRQQFGAVFADIVREGIESGEFPDQAVDVSAACIVGAFTEALVRPVASPARGVNDAQLVKSISTLCVRAVGGDLSAARKKSRRPASGAP